MAWFSFICVFFSFGFFFYSKVQTCESNQVHSRLWFETYAAFLSSDLITRLFSCRVSGAGLSRSPIVSSTSPCEKDRGWSTGQRARHVWRLHGHPWNPNGMQSDLGATQRAICYVDKMDKWVGGEISQCSNTLETVGGPSLKELRSLCSGVFGLNAIAGSS